MIDGLEPAGLDRAVDDQCLAVLAALDELTGGVGRIARRLKSLQDLLGEHQDAVVTADQLTRIADRVPGLAALAGELADRQRVAAERLRRRLPAAVDRLEEAVQRQESRTPDVHPNSP